MVVVRVEDQDRQRAADMASFLVKELDRFNRHALNTRGKSSREFFEERLADSQRRLRLAESRLTAYERLHKVVVASGKSPMQGFADVMSQKMNLQVKRSYVAAYSAPGSAAVRQIDAQIAALDGELRRLPALKNEGSRLALEANIQRKALVLLAAQYEDARAREARDNPTITFLDGARAPESRTRPRRTIMVVAASLAALIASLSWAWVRSRRADQYASVVRLAGRDAPWATR